MSDVYYQPEEHGLQTVGEVSFDNDSYQFDLGVVWWHPERGVFFYAEDSGCSCPSPFEEFISVDDLGQPMDLAAITAKLRSLTSRELSSYSVHDEPIAVQVSRLIERAREVAR